MRRIEYCDINITLDRIFIETHYFGAVGKYIWRDFNDQILVGTTSHDYILTKLPLVFGYLNSSSIGIEHFPDSSIYEFVAKKIIYNP